MEIYNFISNLNFLKFGKFKDLIIKLDIQR